MKKLSELSEEELAAAVDGAIKLLEKRMEEGIDARIAKAAYEGKEEKVIKLPELKGCDHGVIFDEEEYKKHPNMSASEVQKRWPRGWGKCPKGCGFEGIAYASFLHYIAGDW